MSMMLFTRSGNGDKLNNADGVGGHIGNPGHKAKFDITIDLSTISITPSLSSILSELILFLLLYTNHLASVGSLSLSACL